MSFNKKLQKIRHAAVFVQLWGTEMRRKWQPHCACEEVQRAMMPPSKPILLSIHL